MSTSSAVLTRPAERPSAAMARSADLRLFRSEVRLVMGRRRNLALIAVLCCFPVLIGFAVHHSPTTPGDGPPFLSQVTDNGLFLVFTSLTVLLPFFLPLAVAVTSGESVAGEASIGTLRNLLVVPVSRTRLLVVKYLVSVVFAFVCVAAVALVGVVVGLLLFPHGDVTLLSGTTVSYAEALWRSLLVLGYVTAMLAGLAAIGLFVSTLTEVPIGAMAATAVLAIISQIADSIPQISAIHPFLITHNWLAFGDLFRQPVAWGGITTGLYVAAAYAVVFWLAAWARFIAKDVTS
jgi:ABC-2 type transport system permease protein